MWGLVPLCMSGVCLAVITLLGIRQPDQRINEVCTVYEDSATGWRWQHYKSWPIEILCVDPVNEFERSSAGIVERNEWARKLQPGQITAASQHALPEWCRSSTWTTTFVATLPSGYSVWEEAIGWPRVWCSLSWEPDERGVSVCRDGVRLGSKSEVWIPTHVHWRGAMWSWAFWSFVVLGIGISIKGLRWMRRTWRLRHGLCGCGYDVKGLHVCPECGAHCDRRPRPSTPTHRTW